MKGSCFVERDVAGVVFVLSGYDEIEVRIMAS